MRPLQGDWLLTQRSAIAGGVLQNASTGVSVFCDETPLRSVSNTRRNIEQKTIGADFWAGDPTKHFSVKKKGFSMKRGEGFSEKGGLVRISTGKAIQ